MFKNILRKELLPKIIYPIFRKSRTSMRINVKKYMYVLTMLNHITLEYVSNDSNCFYSDCDCLDQL